MTKFCARRKVAFLLSAAVWPAVSYGQSTQTIRVVSYNTQGDVSSPSPTTVIPQIATVLEGIGQQKYTGDSVLQLPDVVGLEETTSNSTTVAPIVADLNTYYAPLGANIFNYSTVQGGQNGSPTVGNGPNALIYNQYKMYLMASVGVGTPQGGTNGEFRQVMRYELQPITDVGTNNGVFYIYVDHYKSGSAGTSADGTTDGNLRNEEAQIVRNDETTLPANAAVLYSGDYNLDGSSEAMYQTLTAAKAPNGITQGAAIDPLNPTNNYTLNWATNGAFQGLMTESVNDLRYRDDLITMTGNVYGGSAGFLNFITGSYHAFGNNGSTPEGGNINNGGNTSINDINGNSYAGVPTLTTTQVFSAMNNTTGSDHLPVVSDFTDPVPTLSTAWVGSFNGGTSWSANKNWSSGTLPNQLGADAVFGPFNTAAATVTLDGAVTAGTITFFSSNSYTLSSGNGGTLTLNNGSSGAAVLDYKGNHTISAPVVVSTSAQFDFQTAGNVVTLSGGLSGGGGVTVGGPGILRLGTNTHTTTISSVAFNGGGTLDITNNTLAINFTPGQDPVVLIASYLGNGYAGGAWTGTELTSSTAAANVAVSGLPVLSVGYADGNTDTGTAASPNQVLVKMTLAGDTNLDGIVDFNDLFTVGKTLNTTGNDWAQGNFNYAGNGLVDFNDLFIMGQNLNQTLGTLGSSSVENGGSTLTVGGVQTTTAVPEPAAILFAGAWAAGMLGRRRKRSRSQAGMNN